MKKQVLSLLLVLCMLLTLVPMAAFAADAPVYLGITSDVHDSLTQLDQWEKNVNAAIEPDMEYMLFCGDYSYEYGSAYIESFKKTVSITSANVRNGGIYTTGNHDFSDTFRYFGGVKKDFSSTPGFVRIGEAVKTDDYIVYCFGTAWGNGTGSFSLTDIAALRSYLQSAPADRPIFVLSHYPLHYIDGRLIINADAVIRLLNNYPNVVFVWGHNHSQDTEHHYGEILTAGDSIRYGLLGSADINFTYVCAGAMKSGAKEPYDGLLAKIENGLVTFTYYEDTGRAVSEPVTVLCGPYRDPAEAKEAAAAEIAALAGDQPTGAVRRIVDKALADLESAENIAAVTAVKEQALAEIRAQQEKESFDEPDWLDTLLGMLDEYLPTVGVFTRNVIKTTVAAMKDSETLVRYLENLFDF